LRRWSYLLFFLLTSTPHFCLIKIIIYRRWNLPLWGNNYLILLCIYFKEHNDQVSQSWPYKNNGVHILSLKFCVSIRFFWHTHLELQKAAILADFLFNRLPSSCPTLLWNLKCKINCFLVYMSIKAVQNVKGVCCFISKGSWKVYLDITTLVITAQGQKSIFICFCLRGPC
jgi:hypothetical protein